MTYPNQKLYISDVTLRDGSHSVGHQYTLEQVSNISQALDEAGVAAIEVTHGDGLGGSSSNYGFSLTSDLDRLEAAASVVKNAGLSVLLLPGVGTIEDLIEAHETGANIVRVATHCTEADISAQHIAKARDLGMDTVGFLMMAHMVGPDTLVQEALKMESYGAQTIYVTDSAGAMVPDQITERFRAVRDALKPETQLGTHCHQNLSLAVANSMAAVREGATRVDVSLGGLGAGAGNTPAEAFVAVADKLGWETGSDWFKLAQAADNLVRPMLETPVQVDSDSLSLGYAGVYGSFMLHAKRAADKYGIPAPVILEELGRRKMVGGQEDMIVDVALDLIKQGKA